MQALDDHAAGAYLARLRRRAVELLGERIVGIYVVNSGARGDYLPGRSDLDVTIVVDRALDAETRRLVADAFRHDQLACPAPRLELVVYRREVAADPGPSPEFELNLNTGRAIEDHVTFDRADEPSFWFVLDLASTAHAAVALAGPPGADLFGHVSRRDVLAALVGAQAWHVEHDAAAPNRVLNDCRAWRWVATGRWSSKAEAAEWAIGEGADPAVVTTALAMRRGDGAGPLRAEAVEALSAHVGEVIAQARDRAD